MKMDWEAKLNGVSNHAVILCNILTTTTMSGFHLNVMYRYVLDGFTIPSEESSIKSVDTLVSIYFKSVGRNSNLLLNIPPNRDGLISDYDVQRLKAWKDQLHEIFATDIFKNELIESSNTRSNSVDYSTNNCIDDNPNTFWTTDKEITTADITIPLPKKQ
jgi:alpha-L-fucosidase